jgi:hypothetical protein
MADGTHARHPASCQRGYYSLQQEETTDCSFRVSNSRSGLHRRRQKTEGRRGLQRPVGRPELAYVMGDGRFKGSR